MLVFQLEFYWDVEDGEKIKEWIRNFLGHDYFVSGMTAHAMALMAEERRHWRVTVEHENKEKFLGSGGID